MAAAANGREQAPGGDFKSIAFYAHKGGVGKSTLIFDAAYQLATVHDRNVVIIDADSQLNSSFKMLNRMAGIDMDMVIQSLLTQEDQAPIQFNGKPVHTLLNFMVDETALDFRNDLLLVPHCNDRVRVLLGSPMLHRAEPAIVQGIHPNCTIAALRKFPLLFRKLLKNIHQAYSRKGGVIILVDMSPNSNVMNQNILLSCDYFVLPSNADDNSMMSQMLLLTYLPIWRVELLQFHCSYLQHDVKLICAVMNRYKIGKQGIEHHQASKVVQKYMDRSVKMVDQFVSLPSNQRFIVPGAHQRFLKVQNGMGSSEVISEHSISMFEITSKHCTNSSAPFSKAKVESIRSELNSLVDQLLEQLGLGAAAPAAINGDDDNASQMSDNDDE